MDKYPDFRIAHAYDRKGNRRISVQKGGGFYSDRPEDEVNITAIRPGQWVAISSRVLEGRDSVPDGESVTVAGAEFVIYNYSPMADIYLAQIKARLTPLRFQANRLKAFYVSLKPRIILTAIIWNMARPREWEHEHVWRDIYLLSWIPYRDDNAISFKFRGVNIILWYPAGKGLFWHVDGKRFNFGEWRAVLSEVRKRLREGPKP